MGYELVDVSLNGGKTGKILQVYIDKPGGVSISDCAKVSLFIDVAVDGLIDITGHYFFEVSSPGLTRKLRNISDFIRETGKNCKIVLLNKVDERLTFTGRIKKVETDTIIIDTELGGTHILFKNIKRANLVL